MVPDVSGDGIADLALGEAEEKNGFGLVTLYNMVTQTTVRELTSPQTVQAERFGATVAGLPDIDGDGRGDLAVDSLGGAEQIRIFSGDVSCAEFEPNDVLSEVQTIGGASPVVV